LIEREKKKEREGEKEKEKERERGECERDIFGRKTRQHANGNYYTGTVAL